MKNKKLNVILTITSIVLSVLALVSVAVAIHKNIVIKTASVTSYSVGAINETGKVIESKQSVYLKDMQKIDGMKIELDEETATITYKVAFYNEEDKFVSMTESLDADFDATNIPETATQFRVVITPLAVDGEAVELNIFNMAKYVNQLDVSWLNEVK